MQGRAHIIVATTFVAAVDAVIHFVPPDPLIAGMAIGAMGIGALLPDIDSDNASIRHQWGLARSRSLSGQALSAGLRAIGVKHRGVTHSLLVTAIVMACGSLLYLSTPYGSVGMALGLGYFAHLLGDMLTISGVPLLWPNKRDFHLLPRPLRFRTGGMWEYVAVGIATGLLILLLLTTQNFILYMLGGLA